MRLIWKKGAGTFLSFSISYVLLVMIFFIALSCVQINAASTDLEEASVLVGRDIIVCESLEEAQDLAESEVAQYFDGGTLNTVSNVTVSVQYAAGSADAWEKGNYITIYISADVNPIMLPSSTRTVRNMVMIERNGT